MVKVRPCEGRTNEASQVYGRADYRGFANAGCSRTSRASAKKMVGPAGKREGVGHLQAALGLSERRACNIVNADRKTIRYRSCRPPDTELRLRLRGLPTSGSTSATAGCSSCCARKANRQGSTASTGSVGRKASPCASGAPAAAPWEHERRYSSSPRRIPAGRLIWCTTNSPAAGAISG